MKEIKTYTVQIWCGLKEHYDGQIHSIEEAETICQKYVNFIGLCVTITSTKYIYTDGNETGFVIGLIAYPRFPKEPEEILKNAFELGKILMSELRQYRITITTPEKSYMLENENIK